MKVYKMKDDGVIVDHLIGNRGYRIVSHYGLIFTLYVIEDDQIEEYGSYNDMDVALSCGRAILDDMRSGNV